MIVAQMLTAFYIHNIVIRTPPQKKKKKKKKKKESEWAREKRNTRII